MSVINIGRGDSFALEHTVEYESGGPVTDETVTATMLDVDGTGFYLDWNDHTFKAAGHTLLDMPMSHIASGVYNASPRLYSLGQITNMSNATNQLTIRYFMADNVRQWTDLIIVPAPVASGVYGKSSQWFDFVNRGVAFSFKTDLVYTYDPDGVPQVLTMKAIFDNVWQDMDEAGGTRIRVQMPILTCRFQDFPSGVIPKLGDTYQITDTGEVLEVTQPPMLDGKNGYVLASASPETP